MVNQILHTRCRAKALGYGCEARLRGLEMCSMNLTTTYSGRIACAFPQSPAAIDNGNTNRAADVATQME